MFGLAWTEIGLIAVVAMVLIGPKDMPVAIRGVADIIKKARRMAGEFQGHVDEMMRDANLHEVRESIAEIRSFDIRGQVARAVDSDGSLRAAFTDDPFKPSTPTPPPSITEAPVPAQGQVSLASAVPAFVPPEAVPAPAPPPVAPPAFIPPDAARRDSAGPGA